MSNEEYFVEYGLHGHMLFKVCEASGRLPPSYRFIKHDGQTTVEVTVGEEGPVEAGPYEHSWRSKGEAIDAWLMKYLPNWFELKVWEASDYKSVTPTLHSYCRSGQLDKVKAALKRGEDVNRIWQHGSCGNDNCQLDLVNACDFKATPLQGAMFASNHTKVISLLLKQPGINLNLQTFHEYTALNMACLMNRPDIVRQLLQADGVDPNIPNEFGRSPLMEAYFHKNQDCVKELLESEAVNLPKCTSKGADGPTFEPWFRKMLVNAIVNREKQEWKKNKENVSELQKKQQTRRGRNKEEQGIPQENQNMLEYNKDKLGEIGYKPKDSTNIGNQLSERICVEGDYQQGQLTTLIPFGLAQASLLKVVESFPNFKDLQDLTVHYLDDYLIMEGNERG